MKIKGKKDNRFILFIKDLIGEDSDELLYKLVMGIVVVLSLCIFFMLLVLLNRLIIIIIPFLIVSLIIGHFTLKYAEKKGWKW